MTGVRCKWISLLQSSWFYSTIRLAHCLGPRLCTDPPPHTHWPAISHSCSLMVVLLSQLRTFNAKSTPIYDRQVSQGLSTRQSQNRNRHWPLLFTHLPTPNKPHPLPAVGRGGRTGWKGHARINHQLIKISILETEKFWSFPKLCKKKPWPRLQLWKVQF